MAPLLTVTLVVFPKQSTYSTKQSSKVSLVNTKHKQLFGVTVGVIVGVGVGVTSGQT